MRRARWGKKGRRTQKRTLILSQNQKKNINIRISEVAHQNIQAAFVADRELEIQGIWALSNRLGR